MTAGPKPLRRYRAQDVAGGQMVLVDQPLPPGTEGGRTYTVTRWDSGAWTCECSEFRYGYSGGDCRHLRAVRTVSLFGASGGAATGA